MDDRTQWTIGMASAFFGALVIFEAAPAEWKWLGAPWFFVVGFWAISGSVV